MSFYEQKKKNKSNNLGERDVRLQFIQVHENSDYPLTGPFEDDYVEAALAVAVQYGQIAGYRASKYIYRYNICLSYRNYVTEVKRVIIRYSIKGRLWPQCFRLGPGRQISCFDRGFDSQAHNMYRYMIIAQ